MGEIPNPLFKILAKESYKVMRKDNIKKNFWINQSQDNLLKEKCNKTGLTEKEYFVRCIEEKPIAEKPGEGFYKSVATIIGIANNLNQIARVANSTGEIEKERYKQNADIAIQFMLDVKKKYKIGKR